VDAWRTTADAAHRGQRGDAHDAKKRLRHRHHDPWRHRGGFGLAINRDDALEEAGKFLGQRARVGALGVEAIGQGELDLKNANLEHVSGHRPVDVDRPSQNVRTGTAIGDFAADGADIFRHGARGNYAGSVDIGRIRPAYRFDGDDVAGIDR